MLLALRTRPLAVRVLVLGALLGIVDMVAVSRIASEFPSGWLRVIAFGIPRAVVVLGCVAWEREQSVKVPRLLYAVGVASYSLYLSHFFVVAAAARLLAFLVPPLPWWLEAPALGAMFLACLAVALASYRDVERSLSRLARAAWSLVRRPGMRKLHAG